MYTLLRNHKFLAVLLIGALLALVTVYEPESDEEPGFLGRGLMWVTAPVQGAVVAVVRGIEDAWYGYIDLTDARKEAAQLREEAAACHRERENLAVIEEENIRLRRLLGFMEEHHLSAVAARVIATDILGQFRTVTINRGSEDGIRAGSPVLNDNGVVGTVLTVFSNAARVLLMIDPNSAIDGRVRRTGAQGIVQGGNVSHKLWCQFAFSLKSEDVEVGDEIVTSGLDQQFPPGLLLGTVEVLDGQDVGIFHNAAIRPAVDFTRLREVLVTVTRSAGP